VEARWPPSGASLTLTQTVIIRVASPKMEKEKWDMGLLENQRNVLAEL